jgi:DNA repair photolyase
MARVEYREEPCKIALSPVKGMHFEWSLNPYMGCVHRCTFCYVRAFERRADRPSDDRYGISIRVKPNIAEVLRHELRLPSRRKAHVAIGSATDPYQPAEGRYKLTRACIQILAEARTRFSIITRGPLAVRDADIMAAASTRVPLSISFSVPTLDPEVWQRTEPGTAPPRQRLRALRTLVDAGVHGGVSIAPVLPGLSDRPEQLEVGSQGRARFRGQIPLVRDPSAGAGDTGVLPELPCARLAGAAAALREHVHEGVAAALGGKAHRGGSRGPPPPLRNHRRKQPHGTGGSRA